MQKWRKLVNETAKKQSYSIRISSKSPCFFSLQLRQSKCLNSSMQETCNYLHILQQSYFWQLNEAHYHTSLVQLLYPVGAGCQQQYRHINHHQGSLAASINSIASLSSEQSVPFNTMASISTDLKVISNLEGLPKEVVRWVKSDVNWFQ